MRREIRVTVKPYVTSPTGRRVPHGRRVRRPASGTRLPPDGRQGGPAFNGDPHARMPCGLPVVWRALLVPLSIPPAGC